MVTMLAASSAFEKLVYWLRGSGLESVLIISGAILIVRGLHYLITEVLTAQRPQLFAPESESDTTPEPDAAPGFATPAPDILHAGRGQALAQAVSWLATAVVSVAAGAMVAERIGLSLATLIPTATVAGLAVGFGAQQIMQDILSGFFLLAEHQVDVGDLVTISAPGTSQGVSGTVEEVTLRVTRLRTLEGDVVFIPNGEIRQLTNQSAGWARLVIDVPLRPQVDVTVALDALRQVSDEMSQSAQWSDRMLEGPDVLGVQAIAAGVLQIRLIAKVASEDQWDAARELRRRVAIGLADAGIEPIGPLMIPGSQF